MSDTKIDDTELIKGLDGLLSDIFSYMSGSAERLNEEAKNTYIKNIKTSGRLYRSSNKNNGKEWFTPDNGKWYITNKWRVPNSVWSARNFLEKKKNEINGIMKKQIGIAKQKEIDGAIEYAVSNF